MSPLIAVQLVLAAATLLTFFFQEWAPLREILYIWITLYAGGTFFLAWFDRGMEANDVGRNNPGELDFKLNEIQPPEPRDQLSPKEIFNITEVLANLSANSDDLTKKLQKKYIRLDHLKKAIYSPFDPILFKDISPQKSIFLIKMYEKNHQQKIVPLTTHIFSMKSLPNLIEHKNHVYTHEDMSKPLSYEKSTKTGIRSYPTQFFWQKFDEGDPENTYEIVKLNKDLRKILGYIESGKMNIKATRLNLECNNSDENKQDDFIDDLSPCRSFRFK